MYSGGWKNNQLHGYGEFSWANGKKFTGNYEFDLKAGKGRFEWPDGKVYDGMWSKGQ